MHSAPGTWKIEIYRFIHQRNILITFGQNSAKEKVMNVSGEISGIGLGIYFFAYTYHPSVFQFFLAFCINLYPIKHQKIRDTNSTKNV